VPAMDLLSKVGHRLVDLRLALQNNHRISTNRLALKSKMQSSAKLSWGTGTEPPAIWNPVMEQDAAAILILRINTSVPGINT